MNTIESLKNNSWKDSKGHYWNDPKLLEWKYYRSTEVRKGFSIIIPDWWSGLNDTITIGKSMHKFMSSINRTLEEWYSRFIINLPDVPECENPNCSNKVKLAEGKLSHGLRSNCCKSCGQSVSNIKRWKNPCDYLNQEEYKLIKSKEMTENLKIWNYDLEFQAKCQRGKIYNRLSDYVFYIAITRSGHLKYGIYQSGSRDYRLFMQREYNGDPYDLMVDIFRSDNRTIADFEYEIKSKFNFNEYLNLSQYSELQNNIKSIYSNYKLQEIDQLPDDLTSTTIEKLIT